MSDNLKNSTVLLIGTGPMAVAYAKVLQGQKADFQVVGRGETSADAFFNATGKMPITGGLQHFLENNDTTPFGFAILATGTEVLADCLQLLIHHSITTILIEKPAAVSIDELNSIKELFMPFAATILVAYNRRFYASVLETEKLLAEAGGLQAMNFEFTEWTHKIDPAKKVKAVLNNWFFANSTHVVDLAFFLAGKPVNWSTYTKSGTLDWHDKTIFSGAGITDKAVVFSYLSHWESAGRWGIELLTQKNKIYLKPLEGILVQPKGTITPQDHVFDDSLDQEYKPGLYKQVEAFLSGDTSRFITIAQQLEMGLEVYSKMLA
jgi:predicted dehydrogenase